MNLSARCGCANASSRRNRRTIAGRSRMGLVSQLAWRLPARANFSSMSASIRSHSEASTGAGVDGDERRINSEFPREVENDLPHHDGQGIQREEVSPRPIKSTIQAANLTLVGSKFRSSRASSRTAALRKFLPQSSSVQPLTHVFQVANSIWHGPCFIRRRHHENVIPDRVF